MLSKKKALHLSIATLAIATSFSAMAVSANSKAVLKVGSTPLKMAGVKRNVVLTGSHAIYTKAGTLKGAKIVVSKKDVKKITSSKLSNSNFRVYQYAVTNRGSVYYKVVSFDGRYRGWIYGGKKLNKFAGGIKSTNTFRETKLTTTEKTSDYMLKTPGFEAGGISEVSFTESGDRIPFGTRVTYKSPAFTQYKAGRALKDTTKFANVTDLKISKKGTRSKEGDVWVYITSRTAPKLNGWILEDSLMPAQKYESTNEFYSDASFKMVDENGKTIATESDFPDDQNKGFKAKIQALKVHVGQRITKTQLANIINRNYGGITVNSVTGEVNALRPSVGSPIGYAINFDAFKDIVADSSDLGTLTIPYKLDRD